MLSAIEEIQQEAYFPDLGPCDVQKRRERGFNSNEEIKNPIVVETQKLQNDYKQCFEKLIYRLKKCKKLPIVHF